MPGRRAMALRLVRHASIVVGVALLASAILAALHAAATGTPFARSFALMAFLPLLLAYAVLGGPGLFLARTKLAPIGLEARGRWRRWLATPELRTDHELSELVLYVGIAFLFLALATGIGFVLG